MHAKSFSSAQASPRCSSARHCRGRHSKPKPPLQPACAQRLLRREASFTKRYVDYFPHLPPVSVGRTSELFPSWGIGQNDLGLPAFISEMSRQLNSPERTPCSDREFDDCHAGSVFSSAGDSVSTDLHSKAEVGSAPAMCSTRGSPKRGINFFEDIREHDEKLRASALRIAGVQLSAIDASQDIPLYTALHPLESVRVANTSDLDMELRVCCSSKIRRGRSGGFLSANQLRREMKKTNLVIPRIENPAPTSLH